MSEVADNKIEYGLCNVYYALLSYNSETSTYSYQTPVRIPGAVNLSMDPSGNANPFYADNVVYFDTKTNAGYEGDLEIAVIPEHFKINVLGEVKRDGILLETSDTQGKEFALLFQFDGDKSGRRFVFYRCSADRPSVKSQTREESTTPNTNTIKLKAMAREDNHHIKGSILLSEDAEKYNAWFTAVQEPEEPAA